MGKMKEIKSVIEDMLSNGFYTYEAITWHLFARYGLDHEYSMDLIEMVIENWDAEERQLELYFGA